MSSHGRVEDPAFSSAVEAAYLAALAVTKADTQESAEKLHAELLEHAIYKADPTNGGLRFKRLANGLELEHRLMRVLMDRLRA